MKEAGFNLDRMRLVCNRMGCEGGGISLDDVGSTLNMPVFAEIPDEWVTINNAINVGEPLSVAAPKSKVRQAIAEIARRLHAPEGLADEEDTERKKGGLLSKIF